MSRPLTSSGRDHGPHWRRLPDGRLHAQHGPIDLVILVSGPLTEQRCCEAAANASFESVLAVLADELGELRREIGPEPHRLTGPVASRMYEVCRPYRAHGVSPMAAVAGAVADHVLSAMLAAGSPTRACVNNGGDIALYVEPGESLSIGVADLLSGECGADVQVEHDSGIGGIATSGWRGRSHSLGIADAVTVLASSAAEADVAATLIANRIDLTSDAGIQRQPARELSPDSDLGDREVTVAVPPLDRAQCATALAPGIALSQELIDAGHILGARLHLQSEVTLLAAKTDNPSIACAFTGQREPEGAITG